MGGRRRILAFAVPLAIVIGMFLAFLLRAPTHHRATSPDGAPTGRPPAQASGEGADAGGAGVAAKARRAGKAATPAGAWAGASEEARLTSASQTADATLQLKPGAKITGCVTDENRQPIEGVRIECDGQGGAHHAGGILTGADGRYSVAGLAAGVYNLSIQKEGYRPEQRENVAVTGENEVAGIDITLKKGRAVAGFVVDTAGRGLPAWVVTMVTPSPTGDRRNGSAITGADGKFTILSGLPSTVRFYVFSRSQTRPDAVETYSFLSGEIELPEGESPAEPLKLVVDVAHAVKGRVVLSGSKKPVPGAEVQVLVNATGNAATQADGLQCAIRYAELRAHEKTGEDGVFTLENVPNGRLNLSVTAKNIVRKNGGNRELNGEEVLDLGDIEVQQPRLLTGRLVNATTHEPYQPTRAHEEVAVQMGDDMDPFATSDRVMPGEDGRFALDNVSDTVTHARFTAPGYVPAEVADIQIRTDSPTDLGDILLQAGSSLAGTLIDQAGGKPLTRDRFVQAEIRQAGKTQPRQEDVPIVGDDGKFEIRGVAADVESVTFRSTEFLPCTIATIPTPDDKGTIDLGRVELEIGGRIEGVVVDPKNAPKPGANVLVATQAGKDEEPGPGNVQRYASANGQGQFEVSGLPTGAYRITATSGGMAPGMVDYVQVAVGGDAVQVQVVVGAGAKLKGTLVDLNTRILNGWQVAARPEGETAALPSNTQTGTLGNFEFSGLPAVPVRFLFSSSQDAKQTRAAIRFRSAPLIVSDGDEQVFVLSLGPLLKGRLVDSEGHGVAGARVHVTQTAPASGAQPETGCSVENLDLNVAVATDDSGRFRVGPVAVGNAKIEFSGDTILDRTLDNVAIGVDDERDLGDVAVQSGCVVVGRFVDRSTGSVARFSGDITASGQARTPGGSASARVQVQGRDATFRVTGVPPGATSLVLGVARYLPCEVQDLRLSPGRETDVGDVALDPGVAIRVRLLDADSGAFYDAASDQSGIVDATGRRQSGGEAWNASAGVGADRGVFVFRPAPADLRQITLTAQGCDPLAIDTVPSADSQGIVDLGDRKVRRQIGASGHGVPSTPVASDSERIGR